MAERVHGEVGGERVHRSANVDNVGMDACTGRKASSVISEEETDSKKAGS